MEDIPSLFTSARDKISNAREDACAKIRAQAAGYFLLTLDHAQILFGLVIGKRHSGVC